MSFSISVKEELSKISNLSNKESVKAELFGYLNSNNVSEENEIIKFSTESQYNINRFSKLLNNIGISKYNINIIGKIFCITISKKEVYTLKNIYEKYEIENKEIIEKAFVRGSFLGSGSINNPKNKYHIEIILNNNKIADKILIILQKYNINFKELNSIPKTSWKHEKNIEKYIIYSKDGEEISKFLAFIEASASMLKFEEIRVFRDMRNNVNRIVNCETANLSKTVNAAIKQIDAINKLKNTGKFNDLPESLKEIANLRLENPEASLAELGEMLNEPIGKSGVNYRLKTLIDLAQ